MSEKEEVGVSGAKISAASAEAAALADHPGATAPTGKYYGRV